MVYSIKVTEFGKWDDGIADIGVTVNMQSGERVMLDDLFEMDKLLDWMYVHGMYSEEYVLMDGTVLTEKEALEHDGHSGWGRMGGWWSVRCYASDWYSFYLYEGKLMILTTMSFGDCEIPLPEIYEYLKVDPWYG